MSMLKRVVGVALFILLQTASLSVAQPTASMTPADRTRIAEAYRLADKLGDRLWASWSKAPFAVLLVTSDREFLIRHPAPPRDFEPLGEDSLLGSKVYARARQFDPHLLATFPFAGTPTIVIGQAESTQAHTSTPWVTTLLHEHFHQLQYSHPDYQERVKALGLARGDTTGMWMLEYPFPYADSTVSGQFSRMREALLGTLHASPDSFKSAWSAYLKVREEAHASLRDDDARYLSFQLWQEGIARYTEARIASMAAAAYRPTAAFRALPDYHSFAKEATAAMSRTERELAIPLPAAKRTAFYAIGAAEGLLLDRAHPGWQTRYFENMFSVSPALMRK